MGRPAGSTDVHPCSEHPDGTRAPAGWPRREAQWGDAPPSACTGIGTDVAAARGREGRQMDEGCRWFVGVDWASTAHQAGLMDAWGEMAGERAFAHGGEG